MATNFLKNIDNTWTLFLDRDGVINKRIFGGYVTSPSEFEFIQGVLESIKYFSSIFNRIIIVTNQQGVGKGIMTESELIDLHKYMVNEITNAEGKADAVYYCTELATSPNNCRKPNINMAQKAFNRFPEIVATKSIAANMVLTDYEKTFEWAENIQDSDIQAYAFSNIALKQSLKKLGKSDEWIESLPSGFVKTRTAAGYALGALWRSRDQAAAKQFKQQLSDDELNPPQLINILENSNLPEETRNRMIELLE